MSQVTIRLPSERFTTLEFRQDDLPGISLINAGLLDFSNHNVFPWHCSLLVEFQEIEAEGMPTADEHRCVEEWEQQLALALMGDIQRPNLLRLGNVTWNNSRELMYRIHRPEPVNDFLCDLIESENYPRQFDFRIDHDPEWEHAAVHLDGIAKQHGEK